MRFVRIDAYPQPAFGCSPAPEQTGCCGNDVEQLISLTNATGFPTANIKTGATMSTANMYHYPAVITDSSNTWEVAKYAPDASGIFQEDTTAAVINDFGGRQQMVWFGSWATEWSPTSNFLQHAYIHWMTRGLFLGARKFYLSTQVDDVHLTTDMYYPTQGDSFRLRTADLQRFVSWTSDINSRMPAGSDYFVELGHNGNGDIIAATNTTQGETLCNPDDAIVGAIAVHLDDQRMLTIEIVLRLSARHSAGVPEASRLWCRQMAQDTRQLQLVCCLCQDRPARQLVHQRSEP